MSPGSYEYERRLIALVADVAAAREAAELAVRARIAAEETLDSAEADDLSHLSIFFELIIRLASERVRAAMASGLCPLYSCGDDIQGVNFNESHAENRVRNLAGARSPIFAGRRTSLKTQKSAV